MHSSTSEKETQQSSRERASRTGQAAPVARVGRQVVNRLALLAALVAVVWGMITPGTAPVAGAAEMPLEGTTWHLIAYQNSEGRLVPAPMRTEASITFRAGHVGGHAGCNLFFGSYTRDGSKLTVAVGGLTLRLCERPLMELENAYLSTLGKVVEFVIAGHELRLNSVSGVPVLIFTVVPSAPLVGPTWRATAISDGRGGVASVIAGTEVTAIFQDREMGGNTGCNRYGSSYRTSEGNGIRFDRLVATQMACLVPQGVMEQEAAFMRAMEAVRSYRIQGDRLDLLRADGSSAVTFVTG
jgi:heat shock protein HslJ